jgi:tetratricopeptide (TPR) repeat protein
MENLSKVIEELLKAILPSTIAIILGLFIEYAYFLPSSQSVTGKEREKAQSLLFNKMFVLILAIAFFYGIFQLWSAFSLVVVYLIFFGVTVFIGLHIHNMFYGATFLRLKYYQQRFNENYAEAAKTLQEIANARPNDLNPLLEQADIYLQKTQDYKSAIATLQQVLAKNGDNYAILDNLRMAYWGLLENTNDEAILFELIITIERMLVIKATNADLVCELSKIYFYLKDFKTGMEKINTLLSNLSESAEWAKIQSPEKARITFTNVIESQSVIISLLSEVILLANEK